ncbi:hypothetical protein NQ315_001554 [Exocentrus adspersus]|uniref:PPIase cyclophilin-type domain-containing protein n=1 Tax=Exocentrus adspersus TaxID=1586481 RepID=A0AAV8WB64_9CUCU|nr:hypothetical protein NQ315_001554 [Exocentrus adspersus]
MSVDSAADSLAEPKQRFTVVGIITSDEFQKCRFVSSKLFNSFPNKYAAPEILPMLDVEWEEYLVKASKSMRRKRGNGLWTVTKSVVVFIDDDYLGDDVALEKHVSKKYKFSLTKDWYEMGKCHLVEYLQNIMNKFRQLAYLTISIDNRVAGTLLFELYNDIVPLACENFLGRCKEGFGGYAGTSIQRVVQNGWIQGGGLNLPEKQMRCENYAVPHNRRGVLSTCNTRRHFNNSTQFNVALAPTPWMDYNYVAFGQLIQGADVLKQIEQVDTYYQSPKIRIDIVRTGELVFSNAPDYVSSMELDVFQHMPQSVLLDTLLGPPRAPVPSRDSDYQLKGSSVSQSLDRTQSPVPGEGGDKIDYEYFRRISRKYFDPFYYMNLSYDVPLTPANSDITV